MVKAPHLAMGFRTWPGFLPGIELSDGRAVLSAIQEPTSTMDSASDAPAARSVRADVSPLFAGHLRPGLRSICWNRSRSPRSEAYAPRTALITPLPGAWLETLNIL